MFVSGEIQFYYTITSYLITYDCLSRSAFEQWSKRTVE